MLPRLCALDNVALPLAYRGLVRSVSFRRPDGDSLTRSFGACPHPDAGVAQVRAPRGFFDSRFPVTLTLRARDEAHRHTAQMPLGRSSNFTPRRRVEVIDGVECRVGPDGSVILVRSGLRIAVRHFVDRMRAIRSNVVD